MTLDLEALVRPAAVQDVQPLEEFIRPFVESDRLLPRTTGELTSLIENGFVAELQGRIAGFAALEVYSPKLAEIRSLAVAPIHQGRGIGRRLVVPASHARKNTTFWKSWPSRRRKISSSGAVSITRFPVRRKRCSFKRDRLNAPVRFIDSARH